MAKRHRYTLGGRVCHGPGISSWVGGRLVLPSFRKGEPVTVADTAANTEPRKLGVFNQLARFIIIGGGCAVIDFGTYSLLLGVLGWPIWLSKSLSFILGTTASYVINRKFTFQGAGQGNTTAKAGAFVVLYTTTFFVNMGSNQLLCVVFNAQEAWQFTLFWVIAQGLGTMINFIMLKLLIFRD